MLRRMATRFWIVMCTLVCLEPVTVTIQVLRSYDTYDNLTVAVTGTTTSAIDSWLDFNVQLQNDSSPLNTGEALQFDWSTNACLSLIPARGPCENVTVGNGTSELRRPLTRFDVRKAGQYNMAVIVKARAGDGWIVLGEGNHKFTLTEHLHGQLELEQNATAKRTNVTFSTDSLFTLRAALNDKLFGLKWIEYTWVLQRTGAKDNSTYHSTAASRVVGVAVRGLYDISVALTAFLDVKDGSNATHSVERQGFFSTKAEFIDPVENLNFEGNTTFRKGDRFRAKVKCYGSGPFVFDVAITDPSQNTILVELIQSDQCEFTMTIKSLSSVGAYLITYNISNPVAAKWQNVTVQVHNAHADVSADLVPVFSVVVAVLALFLILYVYARERHRKRTIEAANFSFRPLNMEHDTYKTIKTKLKKWGKYFTRRKPSPLSREISMNGFDSDPDPTVNSPSNGVQSSSSGRYGSTLSDSRVGEARRTSTVPWLERSSEFSGSYKYCSPWLMERPVSPWPNNYSRDSLAMDYCPSDSSSLGESPRLV